MVIYKIPLPKKEVNPLELTSQEKNNRRVPANEKESAMERTPVKSSNVASVGYDPVNKTLEIEFKSGGVYQYPGIESQTHADLMGAESIGKFVQLNIVKAGLKYQKMDPTQKNE